MKHYCLLLATALTLTACSTREPSLSSFKLHSPSSAPPPIDIESLDKPVWSQGKPDEMIATAYATYNNEQNAAKATAWIRGDAEQIELCYHVPYYTKAEMPPLKDPNVAYAAAAWIVPIEFHVRGLRSAPRQSTISNHCK